VAAGGRLPLVGVILAGGSGTRLWPVARPGRPKQFIRLLGRETPFEAAWRRLVPLAGRANIVVVAGREHVRWVRRQAAGIRRDRILAEAIGRNTAASVAIAALWARARFGDAVLVVTPADHWIRPERAFRATVARCRRAARAPGALVTIGVPAVAADPGFGYIRPGGAAGWPGVRRVARFVEKPDPARARRMVAGRRWLWNSGIFVWRARSILEALQRQEPAVVGPLARWAARRRPGGWRVPAAVLRRVPAVPIDRAVLERSRRVLVTPAAFRWSDLGNWSAIADLLEAGAGNGAAVGRTLALGSRGCVAINDGGLTVFVGTRNLVTVRAGATVLVCRREAAQRVRAVGGALAAGRGREERT
jgi:mannose-1-phosphate guanylyltransferase/mannose-6-phosphate isomerase